jgi:hypothetical protein
LALVEAVDNCDKGNVRYWDVPIPNPCGTGKAKRRTYEGFDPCGNMVRDTTIILPADNDPPSIVFVAPELTELEPGESITLACHSHEGKQTSYSADAVKVTDACSAGVEVNFEEIVLQSGNCDPNTGNIATLELRWTATDMCGNTSVLSVPANIIDHEPPTFIHSFPEINVSCPDNVPVAEAVDNCSDVEITVTENIIPGPCEFEYEIERNAMAVDACGNVASMHQLIHVGNHQGPTITGVEPLVCDDLSIPQVQAYDACSQQNIPVHFIQDTLEDQCENGLLITRLWTATNSCGHTSTILQQIILHDHTPPEFIIPTNSVILLFLDQDKAPVRLSQTSLLHRLNDLDANSVFVEDNCGSEIIPEFLYDVHYAVDCIVDGYYEIRTYTWVAIDACGNANRISITVKIMDDIPPVISDVPADATFICTELLLPAIVKVEDFADDVELSFEEKILPGTSDGAFDVQRIWTATDPCGNVSSATQQITWIPDTQLECEIDLPSMISCNTHGVAIGSTVTGGLGGYEYLWQVEGSDCFIQSGQGTPEILIYVGFSVVDISLTITDGFGCSTVCEATLDCIDPLGNYSINPIDSFGDHVVESLPTSPSMIRSDNSPEKDEASFLFRAWPNPVNGNLNIRYYTPSAGDVHCTIMNIAGQIVFNENFKAFNGLNKERISTSAMEPGTYLIQVRTQENVFAEVMVVME